MSNNVHFIQSRTDKPFCVNSLRSNQRCRIGFGRQWHIYLYYGGAMCGEKPVQASNELVCRFPVLDGVQLDSASLLCLCPGGSSQLPVTGDLWDWEQKQSRDQGTAVWPLVILWLVIQNLKVENSFSGTVSSINECTPKNFSEKQPSL